MSVNPLFCHPYCASERGTVENRNKALRRILPKGANFCGSAPEVLEWADDYYTNKPMNVLGFKALS